MNTEPWSIFEPSSTRGRVKQKPGLAAAKKDWTRKAIQEAAKKIFFQKGYANCRMEEVAERAGVSKGLIYAYFRNKDDLYVSLMIPVLQAINASAAVFRKELDDGKYRTGKEVLKAFAERYKNLYRLDPEGIRIIQAFQQGDLISSMGKESRDNLNRIGRENFVNARAIIASSMERNLLPQMDPAKLMDLIWGMFIGIVQLEESKHRATKKNHLLEMLDFAFESMAAGICPGSARAAGTEDPRRRRGQERGVTGTNASGKSGRAAEVRGPSRK
jgi:TetR/AcrR family transcriptional regulator